MASTPSSPSHSYFVIESRMRQVAAEIQSTVQSHIESLVARREQLLEQLEHAMVTYTRATKQDHSFTANNIDHKNRLNKKANFLDLTMSKLQFQPPDTALEKALSTMGVLLMPSFAPFCTATGDGLEYAIPNVGTSFTITTRDCFNEEIPLGGETITIEIISYKGNQRTSIPHFVIDHTNGKYTVNYCLPYNVDPESHLLMSIDINGLPMNGSPFMIQIQNPEKMQNWRRLLTFGTESLAMIPSLQEQQSMIPASIANQSTLFDLNSAAGGATNNFQPQHQLHLNSNSGLHLQNGSNNTTSNSILNASSSNDIHHNNNNAADNDMYWDPLMGHHPNGNSTGNNSTATTNQCKSLGTNNSMGSSPAASSSSHSSGQQLHMHQSHIHSNIKANIDSNYQKHFDSMQPQLANPGTGLPQHQHTSMITPPATQTPFRHTSTPSKPVSYSAIVAKSTKMVNSNRSPPNQLSSASAAAAVTMTNHSIHETNNTTSISPSSSSAIAHQQQTATINSNNSNYNNHHYSTTPSAYNDLINNNDVGSISYSNTTNNNSSPLTSTTHNSGIVDGKRRDTPPHGSATNLLGFMGLYVGNLSPDLTKEQLEKIFSKYGEPVKAHRLLRSPVAFVKYENTESPRAAIEDLYAVLLPDMTLNTDQPLKLHFDRNDSQLKTNYKPTELPTKGDNGECYNWRTTICRKGKTCPRKHIPINKGIDFQMWMIKPTSQPS